MQAADLIVHAGDISTTAAFEEIARLGPPVHAVHGNVDECDLRRRLPAELELTLGGVTIALMHDAGPSRGRLARMRRRFPTAAAVIFGHSHLPLHDADDEGFQIFNPGSPTLRRRAPEHTMGIARIAGSSVSFEHVLL
jgi:putative phosphoesterase